MKVITEYPIMVNNKVVSKGAWSRFDNSGPETFSYLTASSPTNQIKGFQDWMDIKYPNWVNGKNLNKGTGYGTFGPSTKKAWEKYGKEYVSGAPNLNITIGGGSGVTKPPTQAQKEEAKKEGMTWDSVNNKWVKVNEGLNMLTQTIGGIKNLFGRGESAPIGSAPTPSAEPEVQKKSNLPLIIGIGVAAAIVIAIIVVKNKKG